MTINPDRLRRIRNHHERAVTGLHYGKTPTTHETLELIGDLTDLLNEYTNTHRSQP